MCHCFEIHCFCVDDPWERESIIYLNYCHSEVDIYNRICSSILCAKCAPYLIRRCRVMSKSDKWESEIYIVCLFYTQGIAKIVLLSVWNKKLRERENNLSLFTQKGGSCKNIYSGYSEIDSFLAGAREFQARKEIKSINSTSSSVEEQVHAAAASWPPQRRQVKSLAKCVYMHHQPLPITPACMVHRRFLIYTCASWSFSWKKFWKNILIFFFFALAKKVRVIYTREMQQTQQPNGTCAYADHV